MGGNFKKPWKTSDPYGSIAQLRDRDMKKTARS